MDKKPVLGVQLYSVREDLMNDFEGTLAGVAAMGYKDVEFAGYYGDRTGEEIRAILDKYGLMCISVHQRIDMFLEQGQKAVDFFKVFGVKYVTVPWYPKEEYASEEGRAKILSDFTKVAKLLKDNGMFLQYHNHEFEFGKLDDGRYYLDWLYDSIPDDLLKAQLDLCWIRYAGEDPVKYIEKYDDRIPTIHFKDFDCDQFAAGAVYGLIGGKANTDGNRAGFHYRPLGMGIQDMDALIEATGKTCNEYVIVEQDQSEDRPPMEAIRISAEFLKAKGF